MSMFPIVPHILISLLLALRIRMGHRGRARISQKSGAVIAGPEASGVSRNLGPGVDPSGSNRRLSPRIAGRSGSGADRTTGHPGM